MSAENPINQKVDDDALNEALGLINAATDLAAL